MGLTKIEWTDRTWNPTRGCSRVSEGCRNCYAERIAARFANTATFAGIAVNTKSGPRWTGKVELIESKLTEPLHWKKAQRVFVNSMSDLFHEALPDEAIDRVFAVMALCPHLTFQVLTKRPARMEKWRGQSERTEDIIQFEWKMMHGQEEKWSEPKWPLPNVWLGVSVEDQATADERIPLLLQTPAAIHFVSYEPALGPVDFQPYVWRNVLRDVSGVDTPSPWKSKLDWIIAGGESGPGARPHDPEWFRRVRDQCVVAGVPFFFKQWGEYAPMPPGFYKGSYLERVGKKKAGALLDGREWKEFPYAKVKR
jgi:protein gp37